MSYINFHLANVTNSSADLMYVADVKVTSFNLNFSGVTLGTISGGAWDGLNAALVVQDGIHIEMNDAGILSDSGNPELLGQLTFSPSADSNSICLLQGSAEDSNLNPISNVSYGLSGDAPCVAFQASENPPTCSITKPIDASSGDEGSDVNFLCQTTDPLGAGLTITWDTGDGNFFYTSTFNHTYANPGTYTITCEVESQGGAKLTSATQTVTITINEVVVGDTSAPVIAMSGNHLYSNPQMSEIGDAWVEPGVTATDNVDGSVSVTTDVSGLDVSTIGTYFVNYSATDSAGNTGTAQRTVVICDNAEPTLTLIGNSSITLVKGSGTYTDAGATAMDGGGDVTDQIVVSGGPVDTNTVGTYTLTYNVSDASGNAATPVTRTIVIEAVVNVPPVITLTGDAMVMVEVYGGVWTEPGYLASDAEDGDITADVVVTYTKDGVSVAAIDDDVAGAYQVIYTVTDSAAETSFTTRSVMVGEHNCLVVEDLGVTGDTPNLSGLTLVANNVLDYNGTDIDVSAYTSGMWASLAENVGLTAEYITASSLDVQSISGVAITDLSHWEAFPVTPTQSLNLSAYIADHSFGTGIGLTSTQTAPVEETLIKFISYLGERRVMAARTLEMFEELTSPNMSYPFAWHCALDSKFAAQDITLMASNSYGSVALAEKTEFPREFVQFRLDEMYSRGAIDAHTYHRKRYNADGAGLVKTDGTKYQLSELAANSPTRHSLVQSNLKTSFSTTIEVPVASVPVVLPTQDVTATNAVYDQVHNAIDPNNPTQRLQTQFVTVGRFTENPSAAVRLSTAVLMRSLDNNLTSVHFTPEFLGGLYTSESGKTSSRSNVLSKVVEIATTNGVDISSYTG